MPSLIGRRGEKKGKIIHLEDGHELKMGRDEKHCDFIFEALSVSRVHAQIWKRNSEYVIEDKESRNKTYLNGLCITGKGPFTLKNGAIVRICENEFEFTEKVPNENGDEEGSSTIEATLSDSSKKILEKQSAEKLALLLEITAELTQSFDVEQILPKVVEALFKVFKQAHRAFLVFAEEETGELRARVIQTRKEEDRDSARFSRSIIQHCLDTGDAFLCKDTKDLDANDLSESVHQSRIRSIMCAPLQGRSEEIVAAIQLDTEDPSKKFTEDDLKFVKIVAAQAAIALENASRAGLERDLKLAHEIQVGFLPRAAPQMAGYEFAASYEPAQAVGGDYYDFIQLPDQRMAVMIGDVAGKGVSAALLMAKVSAAARYALLTQLTPAAAVAKLNQQMCEIGIYGKFVTLTAAILDPSQSSVTLVNAGHLLPLLYRNATGKLESALTIDQGNLPLGVLENATYEEYNFLLDPGDSFLLFTDGVIDAQDGKGRRFDTAGIYESLKKGPFTPEAMASHLFNKVEKHSKGHHQFDDVTIVTFGRD